MDYHDLINYFNDINRERKPTGWGPDWPINHLVIKRDRTDLTMIRALQHDGWKLVLCSSSNKDLISLQCQLKVKHPTLRTFRMVSKGQHLIERLSDIGIDDFKLSYYRSACAYTVGPFDRVGTLETLRTALNAAGSSPDGAEGIFKREYEDYRCELPDAHSTDVWLFTNTRFNAMMTGYHRFWWENLGFVDEYTATGPWDAKLEANRMRPKGRSGICVIYVDPPSTEFDEYRSVLEEDVDDLKSARKNYPKHYFKRQAPEYWIKLGIEPDWAEQKAQKEVSRHTRILREPVHMIGYQNNSPVEYRPAMMRFGTGFGRGFVSRSDRPKLVVLTSNHSIAKQAEGVMLQRDMVRVLDLRRGSDTRTVLRRSARRVFPDLAQVPRE